MATPEEIPFGTQIPAETPVVHAFAVPQPATTPLLGPEAISEPVRAALSEGVAQHLMGELSAPGPPLAAPGGQGAGGVGQAESECRDLVPVCNTLVETSSNEKYKWTPAGEKRLLQVLGSEWFAAVENHPTSGGLNTIYGHVYEFLCNEHPKWRLPPNHAALQPGGHKGSVVRDKVASP